MKRSGFTLIELIFVIVIIGILAAVALPKFKNLKANAYATDIVAAVSDLNGSGGASAYLNAVELNDISPSDLNLTDIYKFQGKDWTENNTTTATFRSGKSDFNGTVTYNDGNITVVITCDPTKSAGKSFQEALSNKGLDCSFAGTSYSMDLETQD